MKKLLILLFAFSIIHMLSSCKSRTTAGEEQIPVVTVTAEPLVMGDIENEISFNGSTVYLKKNPVVSPISGYVIKAGVRFGQEVRKNDVLFELKTRESKALETGKDTSEVAGVVKVTANSDGFINELNINEAGAYVAEGSIICNIVNNKDLMIRLNVPFEYISVPGREKRCKIRLTDNSIIPGSVFRILPSVDEANQTQTILIKPETGRQLPENLNLLLTFINEKHVNTLLVDRSSLMTNETQSEFWVMKIENGNTAVKVPVMKGLENDSITEIISTDLHINDLIISNGSYGLPDSTIVSIIK
jgi:hypothetical protein